MAPTQFREEDLDVLRDGLRAAIGSVAVALLGEPTQGRRGPQWRWGSRGSLAVDVRGAHVGRIKDFEADEGGDPFWLIMRELSCGFGGAVEWARKFLGLAEGDRPVARPRARRRAQIDADEARETAAKNAFAQRLWSEGVPIDWTAAETYLTTTRRIPVPHSGWPSCLRYHAQRRALVIGATDEAGVVRTVQLVFLDADGRKCEDRDGLTKRSFGVVSGAVVRLPALDLVADDTERPLLLAEGVETGLSVWASSGLPTWIALGSLRKVAPPAGRSLVLCADDDPLESPAAKGIRRAVAEWRLAGHGLALAYPWPERRGDKSDYNDLLKAEGPEAVATRIALAITNLKASATAPATVSQAKGRALLEQAYEGWYEAARVWLPPPDDEEDLDGAATLPPPVHAIRVTVGGGKSHWARWIAVKALRDLRRVGDAGTIVIAVPRHDLGAEYVTKFAEMAEARGIRVRVWRGRDAWDPDQPGRKMCWDLDAVRDAERVGADVQTSVCHQVAGKNRSEATCPFKGMCGYQQNQAETADIWLVAHELIYSKAPRALGKIRYLIVDESCWAAGLEGISKDKPLAVSLDALSVVPTIPGASALEVDRLGFIYRLSDETCRPLPDGPLSRADVAAAGITLETAQDGRKLSFRRKVEVGLRPGMTPAERAEVLKAAVDNPTIMKLGRFFKGLEELLKLPEAAASGWISLETRQTDAGPQRILRLRGRRKVGKKWRVPTIVADANLNPLLLRPYWSQIQVTAEVDIEAPHLRVRQLMDRDVAKSSLIADAHGRCGDTETARRDRNLRTMAAAALREARQYGGRKCLVVAQQAVTDAWEAELAIPSYVDLQHHNAIAGRDDWRHVPAVVVVGRTLPRVSDVEAMAGALTGVALTPVEGQLPRVPVPIFLPDGTARMVEGERHPDEVAEAIRWQICEGEILQIIGRGRGVNRTKADPLEVLVLTNRPLPIPVEPVSWESVAPSPADLMLAIGGVALASPADAARAYPDLWSAEGAKKKFQRWREAHPPRGRDAGLGEARYQRAGAGNRPNLMAFDPAVVADPAKWAAERLGDLAELAVTHMPPRVVEDGEPFDQAANMEGAAAPAPIPLPPAFLVPIAERATPPPPLLH